MIINKTKNESPLITRSIEDAVSFFLNLYDIQLHCHYEIILCDSTDAVQDEWRSYYGYGEDRSLPISYDGQFLYPERKTDTLTILACVNEKNVTGAEQYYKEVENGVEPPSEQRGLKLIGFFEFIELLLHEFSHLCSYDRMMALTDWADPQMPKKVMDYHLHDEFIARVRGTEAMIRMCCDLMETDLIYSSYLNYGKGLVKDFNGRCESIKEYVDNLRMDLQDEIYDRQEDIGEEPSLESLREELGEDVDESVYNFFLESYRMVLVCKRVVLQIHL